MSSVFENGSTAEPRASTQPDWAALEQLRPELLAFARSRARTAAEADDIVQIALLRAVEKLDTLSDASKLRAWMFTILRRTLIDQARKSGRERLTKQGELPENDVTEVWGERALRRRRTPLRLRNGSHQ